MVQTPEKVISSWDRFLSFFEFHFFPLNNGRKPLNAKKKRPFKSRQKITYEELRLPP